MPFVQAKCTNCGSNLQVDNTKDAAICQYCGTPFIVEKAVNNYNVINNINSSVVNIYGGNSADFVIRAGTLEKYRGAKTHVVIPNSVTRIGAGAFTGCTGLTSITIPDSVTSIEDFPFMGCTGLTNVIKPKHINQTSFYGTPWYKSNKLKTKPGCYIATAVYGSYDCPEVWTLRRFRDYSLALTWYGRLFITLYYAISPTIVKWFGHTRWFNKMWKGKLDRMVNKLNNEGVENTPYDDIDW